MGPVLLLMFCLCLAQNASEFYYNYWLSEWDSINADSATHLNQSSTPLHLLQMQKIKGFGIIGLFNSKFIFFICNPLLKYVHYWCLIYHKTLFYIFCSSFKRTCGINGDFYCHDVGEKIPSKGSIWSYAITS